ncbi:uncharacterized protein [Haliotis cracherodii]|uniref:uncharacterized protein n=1 Tax=Haliotis cracherodii TaxID=6455 RepID=UPI0039EC400D
MATLLIHESPPESLNLLPSDLEESVNTLDSLIKSLQEAITLKRKQPNEAQMQLAERMVKRSKRVLSSMHNGDNATVPMPHVDLGRSDPRNIKGVVIECSDNDLYTIAVKGGILNGKFSRNQFDVCATALYSIEDVVTDKNMSLRQAVQFESNCGGQGFTRCNCWYKEMSDQQM